MKRILILVSVLACALIASACAPAPTPTAAPTSAPAATTAPTSAPTSAPTTAAVTDEWGTVTVKKGDTIKVGFSAALTGDLAVFGLDMQLGAQMDAADFGKDVFPGFNIEIVSEDDQCSGPGGTTVANKFAANKDLVAAVSFMCSSGEIPGTEILDKAHIVSISPSATAINVTTRGLETVSRVNYSDAIQGPADATFIKDQLKFDTIAVIHDGSPYGQGLAEAVRDAFTKGGGKVTDFEAVTVGEKDFRAVLTKIAANKPQLIFFGGFISEGAVLVTQKNDVGLKDAVFMGADGINSPKYIELAAGNAEGSYASFGSNTKGPGYDDFVKKYQAKGGKPENILYGPQTYDAVHVIALALQKAGKLDANGDLVIGRKALAQAVRATKGLVGVTGDITFDSKGDLTSPSAEVLINKVQGGKFVQFFPAPKSAALPDLKGRAIKVGSDTTYPPFETVDTNQKPVGFEIDLMNEVCKKINCQANFVTADFASIFVALSNKQYDMVISGVTLTDERKQIVDFGVPMMKNTETFLVRADETRINSPEDLKNTSIIVATQNGTTNEITAKKFVANPNQVKVFDTFDLAVAAVINKQADVVVIDTFAAAGELGSEQFKGKLKLAGGQFGDEVLAWVFQKGDTQLEDAVNAGLKAVFKDGTYTTLCNKWWTGIDPKPDCAGKGLGLDQ